MDHCFWRLGWGAYDQLHQKRLSTKYDVAETLNCIRDLVEHGAVWKPDDRYAMNRARQALYECEPVVAVDLVKLLAENRACPEETLEEFLGAPRMRQHLSRLGINVARGRRPH